MDQLSPLTWLAVGLVVYSVVCGICGSYCSGVRGRPGYEGFWLGLLLGPFGVVAAACLPGPEKAESIDPSGIADAMRDTQPDTRPLPPLLPKRTFPSEIRE